jgi:hypothetical protein
MLAEGLPHVATRYDRNAVTFLAAVCIAAVIRYWLRDRTPAGRDARTPLSDDHFSPTPVSCPRKLCEEIDSKFKAFLDRPIEGDWPYLWIDSTYVKARGRIVSARG